MANLIKKCCSCNEPYTDLWKKRDDCGHIFCPHCGTANYFEDDAKRTAEEEELNSIHPLLQNAHFTTASEKLESLREKYPKSSKVWFLSVLADNCICYTEDSSKKGYYIPTLNDLPPCSLLESSDAKKALELAPSKEVKESYLNVFNYIEQLRLEIQADAQKKENQYDVFISTKVTLLDENGREVLGGDGRPKESPDCAFARDLYNDICQQYRGKKIFFSQSNDAKMNALAECKAA